ncbi:hypothetical protein HETIRDRAFT_436026 [Heterobasidion irregulare TC 32-1]|uniref:Uncharacterized protein n=1 Tax=Heterobasidion irregulare (strain TC 32-1) TaxID=747525 RepID=W4JYX3_HETIT|nr:uncharacterized protein HETIRDRAFT_436026 [Heterobasidion irregulare TC 32-1]ETW78270.1 hypothetical protein HETIRDRAFT_436026 [Heterobasidion irregulare TC 32-1]
MSRSRYLLQRSSGRGGAGNIRPSSISHEYSSARLDGPNDFSVTRGREPRPSVVADQVVSTGRGGVGNIRSPSRDITVDGLARPLCAENGIKQTEYEDTLIRSSDEARTSGPHSSGRGGVGNITRSPVHAQPQPQPRSRSRSCGPQASPTLKVASPTLLGDVSETIK